MNRLWISGLVAALVAGAPFIPQTADIAHAVCDPAPPGLVGSWQAEGDYLDCQGTKHGTQVGSVPFATGKFGQAFNYPSPNPANYVDLGNPASLKFADAITIAAWIYPTAAPAPSNLRAIVTKWAQVFTGAPSGQDAYGLWTENGTGGALKLHGALNLDTGGGNSTEPNLAGGTIPLNAWSHVALTFYRHPTDVNYAIYVNCTAVSTFAAGDRPIMASDKRVLIGREDSGQTRPWAGLLDQVRVFNRALSAEEISQLAREGSQNVCGTFAFTFACPPDTVVDAKGTVSRTFTINNTGTVTDNYEYSVTDNQGWITPASGTTGPVAPGGSFSVKVTATGDADCNPSSDVLTFSVRPTGSLDPPQTCTTTLTCSPVQITKTLESSANPSRCSDKVIFTCRLSQADATGQVNFFEGLNPIGSSPVVNGSATLSYTFTTAGPHSITAVYKGDGGHLPVTSNKIDQVVNLHPTTTSLASSVAKTICDEKVVFSATVDPAAATGEVNFFDSGAPIGSATLVNGVASLSISTLGVGLHQVTAVYKGDACYERSESNEVPHQVNAIATTILLESEPNPSGCGQDVVFVVTIDPAPGGGTVNFFNNGNKPLGSAQVSGGTATITISTLAIGTHSITAVFKGFDCYDTSTSNKVVQEVVQNPTAVALSSDMNPSSCGIKVTLRARVSEPQPPGLAFTSNGRVYLAPPPPTGTVNFFDNGNPIGSEPLIDSVATLSVTNFTVGTHSITAVYKGDTCYATSASDKLIQVVDPFPTTTTLSSAPNPSACGEKVFVRAVINPAAAGGTVSFFDNLNPIGTEPVIAGIATLSISTLSAGSHSLTAEYSGDSCYASSLSNKVVHEVVPATPTTTLATSPNPSSCGEKVTVTATVNPPGATGQVNFFDAGAPIGSATLVNGVATLSISTLTVGTHPLTAQYKGDSCFTASTSNTVDQEVRPAATTTTLTGDPNPSVCGQKVTLTVRVDPPTATGTVNLSGDVSGSQPLVNGMATFSLVLGAGNKSFTATYKGDSCYVPSQSAKLVQVVNQAPSTTTLTSAPSPSTCGQKVVLTATVSPTAASGEVNFFDGGVPIGSGTLMNGMATLSTTALGLGIHSLTAVYKGDNCYLSSTSDKVVHVVGPTLTTTVLASSPNPSMCDQKVTLTARVDPPTATGVVNFFDSTTAIGSVTIVNGSAMLSITTLEHGLHSFTAVYKGDSCHAPSVSDKVEHFHDCPVAALLSLFLAEPRGGTIELRWQFGDPSLFVETRIERAGSVDGPWVALAAEVRDEGGIQLTVDRTVESGRSYWYRLLARPEVGAPLVFGPLTATAGSTIKQYELAGIWPNPSKNMTRIDFAVPRESNIRLSVMDILGREVAVLAEGSHRPGRYQAVWSGETARGLAPVGMYFVRYQVPGKVMTGRLVLAR